MLACRHVFQGRIRQPLAATVLPAVQQQSATTPQLNVTMQEALGTSRQERESGDAEWDARHQEAVDSAEQWKAFADKLAKEKEEQQQLLATASTDLQVVPHACL